MKTIVTILSSAFVALVIMTFSASAEARPCSECNALSGGAYNNCVATCDDTAPKKRRRSRSRTDNPEPAKVVTEPCPYHTGAEMAKNDCPAGCPDKNMSIKGNSCECSKDNMELSANSMSCECQNGMIMSGGECITPETDCEACKGMVALTTMEVLKKVKYCSSDGRYYTNETFDNNCMACGEGQIDTGMKCIDKPSGGLGVLGWLAILFPWLAVIAMAVTYFLLRRKDRKLREKDRKRNEFRFNALKKKFSETRLSELESTVIPNLEDDVQSAKSEVRVADDAISAQADAKTGKEKAFQDAQQAVSDKVREKEGISNDIEDLDDLDNPTEDDDKKKSELKEKRKALKATIATLETARDEANRAFHAFVANFDSEKTKFEDVRKKANDKVSVANDLLKNAKDEADGLIKIVRPAPPTTPPA